MSDTSSETGAGVSMSKSAGRPTGSGSRGAGNRPARRPVEKVPVPRTINLITGALVLVVALSVIRALLMLGSTPQLQKFVVYTNTHAKKPKKPFGPAEIDNSIHTLRSGSVLQAVLYGLVLLLMAWALRSTRTASATRWAMLVVFYFTGLPFYVMPTHLLPGPVNTIGVIMGIIAIATIVLIFVPKESQQYFRACREANMPPEMRGQPRPGLGSLFGPKRPRGPAGAPGPGGGRRPSTPATTRPATPPKPKTKAKVRADTDAVAKGAELARSRAKASKSRRTPA